MAATTAAGSIKCRARFAAACGVLSQYVKAAAAMELAEARPAAATVALPLMPGADLSPTTTTTQEEHEPASCASSQAQMTIFYGGRVLVLDDVTTDRADELFSLAAAAKEAPRHGQQSNLPAPAGGDLPVARKASLQRFMEKRRSRVAARAAPYCRSDDACPDSLKLAL